MKKKGNNTIRNITNLSFIFLIICELLLFYIKRVLPFNYLFFIFPYLLFIGISIAYMRKNKNFDRRIYFYIIMALVLFIRVLFVIRAPFFNLQRDFGEIGQKYTLDYIYTIFSTGKLPTSNAVQFYHPPLMYFICAVFMKMNSLLGMSFVTNMLSLKIITVSISMVTSYYIYKIINRMDINESNKLILFVLMCLHPAMIFLSIAVNTDSLVTMFVYMIIYKLLEWNDKPSVKNTVVLAIITGLCVMSKFSGALMAVPILFVFIRKLIKEKKKVKNYLSKYVLFGLISLPIGTWYEIRNILLFGSNTILDPKDQLIYIARYSLFDRFITIDFDSLSKITYIKGEYNAPVYIIKTSIFEDFYYANQDVLAVLLLIINIVLITIALLCLLNYLIKRNNKLLNLLLVIYFTYIVGYIIFNLYYPYSCTMDFRYIIVTLLPTIGIMIYELERSKSKIFKIFTYSMIAIFVIISAIWFI